MSNAGQIALDIVGAVAGYFISGGSPTGALYGFALASGAGQFLFPTVLPPITGPRITDHATTSSTLGDPVIIGYGTFPSTGTVNFLAKLVEHPTTTTQGGKGGPTQSSTTFSYTQSIGIGLCETTSMNGVNVPIIGIQRVWENGELVYDTRGLQPGELPADLVKRQNRTAKYALTFTLYLGTEDQEPDPTIELQQGANTPFFRGLAYIVYPDRVLRTDQGQRHPTFRFEIIKAATHELVILPPTFLSGQVTTSLYYPVLAADVVNGRYYISNDDPTNPTVLGFNLLDNTQFASSNPGPTLTNGFGVLAISPDGFVIICGASLLGRLDPLTLAVVHTAPYPSGIVWNGYATATVNFGLGPQYLLMTHGNLNVVTLIDCVSLLTLATYAFVSSEVAAGPLESGAAVFWVIYASGGDIAIDKIVYGSGGITDTHTHTFVPADFDAAWTSITRFGDLIVDPSDGHIMFRLQGAGGGNPEYVLKCNGTTGAIDWITPAPYGGPNVPYGVAQSVITNGVWWLADNVGHTYLSIDIVTGVVTPVDVPGVGGQFGASVTGGGAVLIQIVGSAGWTLILPDAQTPGKVKIADILDDLCERSDLTSHDTSSIPETVDGYVIATTPMTARDAAIPLRSVGFFDSCETGDTLRFVRRGGAPAMTLKMTDIGAYETGTSTDPAPANVITTQLESDLPQQIRLTYMSPARDYQPGQQLSLPRFNSQSASPTDVQLGGVCLDDDQAAQAAEILWNDAWASDHTHTFAVDQSKAALEATDVVIITMVETLMRIRITGIDDASQILRTMTAVSDDDGNYVSSVVAAPVPYRVTMRFYAGSTLVLIDSPLLLDSNDTGRTSAPLYSIVYPNSTDTWTGAVILESNDVGATFANVATATASPATGHATTALGDVANPFLTDVTNSLTVKMQAGSTLPASVTTLQLLDGANGAALVNADGTVEILQFRDVAVVGADTVTLSYLLRGRRGSDSMTGGHAIGDRFVMLNVPSAIEKVNIAITDLNKALQWKAVGVNDTVASVPVVPFTSVGRSLKPRAPWNTRTSLSGSDILINADRRSRIENDSPISFVSPTLALNEDSEAYQVDVYDAAGTSVVRTLSGASLPITYPAANVVTDFGGTPANLWLAVYQMSGEVGRGFTHKVKIGVPT